MYGPQPRQPAAPSKGWRTPIVIVLVALGLGLGLCIGGVVGAAAGGGKAEPAKTVYITASAPGGSAGAGPARTTTKPPAGPVTISDEGVLLVPSEVKPGTYRATVPSDSISCYWARLKAPQDDFESIIANGNGDAGQKMTITIRSSDKAFKTEGCGVWEKIG